MPQEGTVLLVESEADERERLGAALEDAGYHVISCPGPTAPDYTCIGGREGYCPLLERADVVILDSWLSEEDELGVGTTSDELLDVYTAGRRSVVVLGSGLWRQPFAEGRVIYLDERPGPSEIVAAVRNAPEAEGFVLRLPPGG